MDLDDIGWLILRELEADARLSFRELGRRVGLTAPAVAEHVRRMERAGIIRGYRTWIDPRASGLPVIAVIRLTSSEGKAGGVDEKVQGLPEVLECHRVTGAESHMMLAAVSSTDHLEDLLEELWPFGPTVTNIVTSSPVRRRGVVEAARLAADR